MAYGTRVTRSYAESEISEARQGDSEFQRLVRGFRLYFAGPSVFWAVLAWSESSLWAFGCGILVMFANHAELDRRAERTADVVAARLGVAPDTLEPHPVRALDLIEAVRPFLCDN